MVGSGVGVITGLPALYPRWDLRGLLPGRAGVSMWSPAVGKRQQPGAGCAACREMKLYEEMQHDVREMYVSR